MSMTEDGATPARPRRGWRVWRLRRREGAGRQPAPIVPKNTIAGRALIAVVAIMTFLAALTTGAVMLVRDTANAWQSEIAREATVQVRPAGGRDIEADVRTAAALVRATPGVSEARAYSRAESAALLEPWLGEGAKLADLPVPRLIVVRTAPDWVVDFAEMRRALTAQVPVASLDDHRSWIERMRRVTRATVLGGILVLGLVIAATVLSVAFATRGAMAANRPIVEVLHFIGARNSYIAGQFQRHFLDLGLKGGLLGGGAALLVFVMADLLGGWLLDPDALREVSAMFGGASIGPWGYAMVMLQVACIAAVTAATSRRTVTRTLDELR